jgi:acyl-homoserine lactone acylase PvdQ
VNRRFVFGALFLAAAIPAAQSDEGSPLAHQVTIHRDECGVPHIDGPSDESVVFGFGYAQAGCRC